MKLATKIETLDGSLISYNQFNVVVKSCNYYDPVAQKNRKFKSWTYEKYQAHDKLMSRFIPNIIHSLDGSTMRLLLKFFFNKTQYRSNHLHDSIQTHPNFLGSLYLVLNETYKKNLLDNVLEKVIFKPNRINIPSDRQMVLRELE